VLDLAPDFAPRRTLGQALMEWPPIVAIYESRLWRRSPGAALLLGIPFEREAEHVLAALEPRGPMRVLDLACGSGIYARGIARQIPAGHVVALDLSPAMLAYAVARARREHVPNITWVHGDAMNLPLADASIDAVNCCGALHLFPDPARALAEIQRVLTPDGRLVAAVARKPAGEGVVAGLAARLAARSGIASWTQTEFQRRLDEAGFAHLSCHHAGRAWMIWSARRG
jgi:ubiquinone/menaquinone biosynthesis C-methylase UbiE